jgi:hypothetical protein
LADQNTPSYVKWQTSKRLINLGGHLEPTAEIGPLTGLHRSEEGLTECSIVAVSSAGAAATRVRQLSGVAPTTTIPSNDRRRRPGAAMGAVAVFAFVSMTTFPSIFGLLSRGRAANHTVRPFFTAPRPSLGCGSHWVRFFAYDVLQQSAPVIPSKRTGGACMKHGDGALTPFGLWSI